MEKLEREQENNFDVSLVKRAFANIKDEKFGSEVHRKNPDEPEECATESVNGKSLFDREHEALAAFIDKFCTCTLKDPRTRDIVKSVNMHHHTKTCPKHMMDCRVRFPRFPSLRTIISIPAEVKYSDPEVAAKKMHEATILLKKVKDVLENDKKMAEYCELFEDEIETYVSHQNIVVKIKDVLDEEKTGIEITWGSLEKSLKSEYRTFFENINDDEEPIDIQHLNEIRDHHVKQRDEIDLDYCLVKRLLLLLINAGIEGDNPKDIIEKYEDALSISPKRYSVVVKRDIDEINVNLYNPEWIICWNGNMDIQPCLDFFGIITYITDYYMKDDSGTLKFIQEVLNRSGDAPYKDKLNLVKNTFLTHRQIGESEAYYKLFQHLHLSHSNISAVFAPTGFKKNRSRFLKQITEEQACHSNNVIEVEDKEGKYYIEKET